MLSEVGLHFESKGSLSSKILLLVKRLKRDTT